MRTRTNPIVLDDIAETSIPVVLDSHPYSAVAVTDEELTLDIADFGMQVLNPQVLAVAEELESLVAAAIEGAPYDPAKVVDYTEVADGSGAAFYRALVDARKILNDAHVPAEGRFVALGSSVEAAVLKEDAFRKVNVIGNVQGLSPDFAVAAHRSAFANVAPEVPDGATAGGGMVFDGFAIRWIRDYDPNYLRDRSVVSSFAGAASVNDGPEVDIDGAGPDFRNPDSLSQTSLGDASVSYDRGDGHAAVYLTRDERRSVCRAAGTSVVGAIELASPWAMPASDYPVAVSGGGDPIPPGPFPWETH